MVARPRSGFEHPGSVLAASFLAAIGLGTLLLSLPAATSSGEEADLLDAAFTATSAVCVTGLVTVDTGSYWSVFGQVVILGMIQVGGLGVMTLGTLLVLLVSRRLGLRARLIAQAQARTLSIADVRRVIGNVTLFSLVSELVLAVVLGTRFAVEYGMTRSEAAFSGVFHAVSAFNNAGFGLYADNLVRYVGDPWVILSISAAVILGGLGFPVVFELVRAWNKPRSWSVTSRITIFTTVALLAVGTIGFLIIERDNPATLGSLDGGTRLLAGFSASVMPRTAGFNTVDIAAMRPEGLLLTDGLMFVGGGSASTAGGVKVTTFGLLAFVLWAEMRGEPTVEVGKRQIPAGNQREALAVALLGIGLVAVATFTLLALTDRPLDRVLFEAVSALGTVGLSTGITPDLPGHAKWLLVVLMFIGRLGPLTLASALALRKRTHLYQRPEERTIVG